MKKINILRSLSLLILTFSTAILLGGCSPEQVQQQAISNFKSGDYLFSTCSLKYLIEQQPDNPNAYYWLGKNYAAVGDYENAVSSIKKAIELGELITNSSTTPLNYHLDFGNVYYDLAKVYYENVEFPEAAKTLKRANEINPGICTTYLNIFDCTEIYNHAGLIKDAIELHNRYPYPKDEMSRKYRILSYLNIRDHNYNEAINMAAKAIEQIPENELAFYLIGIASGEKGQYTKAIDAFRKAIQIKDNSITPKKYLPMYITLAYYLAQNGQYDAAMTAFNDATQNTKITTYSSPYAKTYYDTTTGTYKTYTAYKSASVSYDDYPSIMATAFSYYNAGKYYEALNMISNYINTADTGKVGMVIKDSYYLKSAWNFNHYIMTTLPDSSAEKAGLQFWDAIVAVDDKSIKGKATKDIINLITGPVGSEVKIKVLRYKDPAKKEGKEIIEKSLVRERVKGKRELDNLARAYGLRSLIYRAQGEIEKAYTDAQTAINYNPESFNAKLSWGLANNDKGNYNEALKILSNTNLPENERLYRFDAYFFLTPYPSDEELIKLGKAIAYLKLGKVNEAINYLPTKEISHTAGPVWAEYQTLSLELTKLAQAHNEKAVKLEQKGFLNEALNEYILAFSYANNEKKETEIRNNMFNLLNEFPAKPELPEKARKYMVRADILLKQNDLNAALSECKKALKLSPYTPTLYYNIAGLNGGLKNYDKAIEYMNIFIKLSPDSTNIQTAKDEITKWELLKERN